MRLPRFDVGLLAISLLSGCAIPQPGVYDIRGVDPVQYNDDLAYCRNHEPFFSTGNPITNCMRDKGYKVLSPG
jgi:hypothetical protein